MSKYNLSGLREIARRFVDEHGWVLACRDCGHVCGSAIGESADFHDWDYGLFLALLNHSCPVVDEREEREIAAGQVYVPCSPEDALDQHYILMEFARQGRKDDFRWFARSVGIRAAAIDLLWMTARIVIEESSRADRTPC